MPVDNGVIQSQLIPIVRHSNKNKYLTYLIETKKRFNKVRDSKKIRHKIKEFNINLESIEVKQKTFLPSFLYFSIKSLAKIKKIIKDNPNSEFLIYTRNYKFLLSVLIIKLTKKIGFIYSPRAPYIEERKYYKKTRDLLFIFWIKMLEKIAIEKSFKTVVETEAFKKSLETLYHLSSKKIKVIPNFFDSALKIKSNAREEIRKKLNLVGKKVIVYAGTLEIWYDFIKMLELFKNLKRKDERLFLQLFLKEDYARTESRNLKIKLERKLKEINLVLNKDYAINSFNPQERYNYLRACDIGICLTAEAKFRNLTMPLKILDYWRVNLPTIVNKDLLEVKKIILADDIGTTVDYTKWSDSLSEINLEKLYSKTDNFDRIHKIYSSDSVLPSYMKLFNKYFNNAAAKK